MMGHMTEGVQHHRWGMIGVGMLIGIWALGPVSIAQATDQLQPEKAVAAPASSNEAGASIELAQVIAQSDLQSRVEELNQRITELEKWVTQHKEIEKWVVKQINMERQHIRDQESLLNSVPAGF